MNNPSGYPTPKAVGDKPRISMQIEQLNKVLASCHEVANNLERAADRILGPVPQDVSKAETAPSPDTIERRMADVVGFAEGLSSRLMNVSTRINSAV